MNAQAHRHNSLCVQFRSQMSRNAVHLMRTILHFESTDTASKICNISDAQNLMDFACHVSHRISRYCVLICPQLVSNKQIFQWWNSRVASNASLLVLEIYARIPVVPRSLFLNEIGLEIHVQHQGKMASSLDNYGINVSRCETLVIHW